jgi:type I restriction-modification system DNA methylase subunit
MSRPNLSALIWSVADLLRGDYKLADYIQGFSPAVRDVFERFRFAEQIDRLQKAGLLYQVAEKFAEISNETTGEHFTPREVIRLMVNLIFIEDSDILTPGNPVVRTIYDPTAGTGGMLSVAGEHLAQHNPASSLTMFGQELNDESDAICKADMLIKGQDVRNIVAGNTLSDDDHAGRFGPGLPRISDGSPLFTGGAGSGESEIRRYVLENDLGEATSGDQVSFFETVCTKVIEAPVLQAQAAANPKAQFINSPSLNEVLMNAVIDSMAANQSMSKQVLNSETVRAQFLVALLGPGRLWEGLRQGAA